MKLKYILTIVLLILFIPMFSRAASTKTSRVCSVAKTAGLMSCNAHLLLDDKGAPLINQEPRGFSPQNLRGAYNLTGKTSASTIIVAIVDAYDDPTIKNDLDIYSKQFGLPTLPLCKSDAKSSTIPCFQKINQRGTAALPQSNKSWAMEIALDVEAVHALCENCSIILAEAASPNIKNLGAAVDAAVKAGADVISNSYGGPEFPGETSMDSHFNIKGIAFTVSSGDFGYGTQYPAASPYVTAVGGTSLYLGMGGKYLNEDAWNGAGSGCSAYESKPVWQSDSKCRGRTVADVSAVADPATGFAVYSSTSPKNQKGWFTVGGTSLAAPIIAAVYAQSNLPKDKMINSLPYLLGNKNNLHDVVGGSNGSCAYTYLCNGKTKYDGPTGLGSPNGTGAF